MKLPLKFREPHCDDYYAILDSNNEQIMKYERYDPSYLPDYEEAKEIVKVTQLFPEAVRLLRMCKHLLEKSHEDSVITKLTTEFLTKLEEDENA